MKRFLILVALTIASAFLGFSIVTVVPGFLAKVQLTAGVLLTCGLIVACLRQANDKDWQQMCEELTAMQAVMSVLLDDKKASTKGRA